MKDCFGQEIKVGSFVIPTNRSSIYFYDPNNIPVVTRIGSTEKVQVNGGAYYNADYLLVVDTIYKQVFGENQYINRIKEVESEFNTQKVMRK